MQALKMLLWVRWRETRLLLGVVLLCSLGYRVAVWTAFADAGMLTNDTFLLLLAGALFFSRQDVRGRSVGLTSHMHRFPLPCWKLVAADLLYTTLAVTAYYVVMIGVMLFSRWPEYFPHGIHALRLDFLTLINILYSFSTMILFPMAVIWVYQATLWLAGPINLFAGLLFMMLAKELLEKMWYWHAIGSGTIINSLAEFVGRVVINFIVPLAISYTLAVWAVRLDRTGRMAALRGRWENLSLFSRSRVKYFASAWQAQVWREGARERGIMLALMAGSLLIAFAIEYSVDLGIRLNPTSWRTDAMIKGAMAAALCAGLLLALRRWRERDALGAGHMLTLPVSTRYLAVARLRADAGVAALGWVVFLLGWVLSGGWADQTPVWVMAAQLAAGMFLIALLYLAALPALTAMGLTSIYWAFLELFWARDPKNFDVMLDLAMGVLVVFMAGLLVYAFVKRALSLRLMAAGLVPAMLAGLTVPLALSAIGGGGGRFPLFYAAAVGALMFWPFIAAPLAMQRMRHR